MAAGILAPPTVDSTAMPVDHTIHSGICQSRVVPSVIVRLLLFSHPTCQHCRDGIGRLGDYGLTHNGLLSLPPKSKLLSVRKDELRLCAGLACETH